MKGVADKYAPGITLELVLWFAERRDTIPTANEDMFNFAEMLALVREGAIPGIEMGDYYTLRKRYNYLSKTRRDAPAVAREIIGDESFLHERFGRIDATNIQIQIDKQKERGIIACANLDKLAPLSVTVEVPYILSMSGRCGRAIAHHSGDNAYPSRIEVQITTFQGDTTHTTVTLSFKDVQDDTYEPRLITTLRRAGQDIVTVCARP